MARILDNHSGRRMIRLTADDVLTVVSLYRQQIHGLERLDYEGIRSALSKGAFYLPEEP